MNFSANLGFLFTELALPDAIHRAKEAGFQAVECHFPYKFDASAVKAALDASGLSMLGLNTVPGELAKGEFGLAAVTGRKEAARAAIDQAVAYAVAIGTQNIHVMAGKTDGGPNADAIYRDNLNYACDRAFETGRTILIEPINHRDVPGYHLSLIEQGTSLIREMGRENLKLMFDCYHTQIMQGDLTRRIEASLPLIGHIQIAAVPDRGEPDRGEVHFANLIAAIRAMGYDAPIGAEYKPRGRDTAAGLGWLSQY